MIFGAILAGGVGTRMNISQMPKQFLPLGDKPIVIHTIEKFLMCSRFDKIYVGVNPEWKLYMKDLIDQYNLDKDLIIIVDGGTDRNGTIINILESIKYDFGDRDDHVIITHDSVRPFVTLRIIEDNITSVLRTGACDTVVAATDTIVTSEDGKVISSIPNRTNMYQGQTPQSFKVNLLYDLYNDLKEEERETLTDACKICVFRGYPVEMIKGEVSNIKITTVSDYKIAIAMVGGKGLD